MPKHKWSTIVKWDAKAYVVGYESGDRIGYLGMLTSKQQQALLKTKLVRIEIDGDMLIWYKI